MIAKPFFSIKLATAEETHRLGFTLACQVEERALVALSGTLGAGKTTFAQGAGAALGITEAINSPTFTTINEYTSGRLPMSHLDLYRLQAAAATGKAGGGADLFAIESELDELLAARGLIIIEWAELLETYLAEQDRIWVALNYSKPADEAFQAEVDACETLRLASISATGRQTSKIVETVRNIYFS